MPGEDAIRKTELYIGSREGKVLARVETKWKDESYLNIEWDRVPGELRFVRRDRLGRNLEYCALEAASGKTRVLIKEGFENAPVDYSVRYLESGEMIWWSEKTGWGHFYLYNKDGTMKNAITSGAWRASQIVAVDEKARVLYFRGNAREAGENVYFNHLYSVKLDGTGLTLLDPGNAYHFSYTSPTRKFLVDNNSRIDRVPFTVLRDEKGAKVMDLETTDVTKLRELGWSPPETFTVKAADGVTDLYGNMWKPFDFDKTKKYPIIAHVYPGPQTEGVTHTFTAYNTNMELAQLGFIVIQVGHRGGSPLRSKAYGSYGYFNMRDYGLEDKKRAIEQLAARHSWIDIKKVGIYGHSGGGFMSAAALLQKPYNEFFKVAVASSGNHDNNIYNNGWAERYHGMKEVPVAKAEVKGSTTKPKEPAAPPVKETKKAVVETKKKPAAPPPTKFEIKVPTNAELAANLKGRLLLVHGEIDNNVHPANTMRLVDALIKARKRFDLLIIPGARHGFGDASEYFKGRMYEFFAEHLLGDRRRGADLLGD
jgi:dipeptidyl aminopeptidase/acylaminoacyl peptidase